MPELVRLFVFPKNKINVFCDLEKLEAVPLSGLTPPGVSLLPTQGLHCCPLTAHALLVRMRAAYSSASSPGFLPAPRPSLDLRTHLCFSYIPVVLTSAPCPYTTIRHHRLIHGVKALSLQSEPMRAEMCVQYLAHSEIPTSSLPRKEAMQFRQK